MRIHKILALHALPALLLATNVTAQNGGESKRSMEAARIPAGASINLDGNVVEDVWQLGTPATGFVQRDPVEGADPSERTEVRVVYDDDNLYIGAILYDSDPSGIAAYQKQRDQGLFSDDRFMWILDTFLDGRTGYFFEINPAGLMGDGLIGGGGGGGFGGGGGGGGFGVNKSWDGIWEARVARIDEGWSAEIQIPFRTLNFNPEGDTWGINFQRTVRRKNEEMMWTGHRRTQQLTRPVHAGHLTGLQGMSQGMGLEVTPYAVTSYANTPANTTDPTEYPSDAGFDVTYNITSSLRASATWNTDFAEVEVDQRRTNLTRFSLRFPERRDFFLEGSGVFSFAQRNGVTPFFSRNVGLNQGEPVPITAGARLGGQAGRYEIGFFQIRTGEQDRIPADGSAPYTVYAEDFTVARVKRSLFDQSSVGAIYTRRATSPDATGSGPIDRHTFGMDLDLYTSNFLGDKNFQFEAFFVHNTDPDPNGTASFADLTARGFRINYPNDLWRVHASYRELPESFRPAVGFTQRNGFRRFQPTLAFSPRPRSIESIRQFEFELEYEHLTDMGWNLETRKTTLKPLQIRWESGDFMNFEVVRLYERLFPGDAFTLNGFAVPEGEYNMWQWNAMLRTAGRRQISGNVRLRGGEFWSGTRFGYEGGLNFRPVPGVNFGADYERDEIDLATGSFNVNLIRFEGGWHISPWASINGNIQYDDQSNLLGSFARLRWIITPGSDIYFVYNHNWDRVWDPMVRGNEWMRRSRGAATKLTYTYRF